MRAAPRKQEGEEGREGENARRSEKVGGRGRAEGGKAGAEASPMSAPSNIAKLLRSCDFGVHLKT